MRRGQTAWLVTWEWNGDHAAVEDRIALILRPRLSSRVVAEIVEHLYARHAYSPDELAAYSRQPKTNPYPVQWSDNGVGMCGHHPWLRVVKVHNLVIEKDATNGLETIHWMLPARYELDPQTDRPRIARDRMPESTVRTLSGPLSDREVGRVLRSWPASAPRS